MVVITHDCPDAKSPEVVSLVCWIVVAGDCADEDASYLTRALRVPRKDDSVAMTDSCGLRVTEIPDDVPTVLWRVVVSDRAKSQGQPLLPLCTYCSTHPIQRATLPQLFYLRVIAISGVCTMLLAAADGRVRSGSGVACTLNKILFPVRFPPVITVAINYGRHLSACQGCK